MPRFFEETEALALLAATPGLGAVRGRGLIARFGSAQQALESLDAQWWEQSSAWEKNLECIAREGVRVIPYTSSEYPRRLLECADAPLVLYIKGSLLDSDKRSLAVVGTRAASIYGTDMADRLSRELAGEGFTIVSGLARGIDTTAHEAALKTGRTIAVIGSGLSDIYPKENRQLADRIAASGAVISEFPMLAPPDKKHFPQRNRIVSGMTLGTLLIEAPEKSGAMITMERALEQKRKLFAIPGRADQENFRGNHAWIKSGKAFLVENSADILKSFDHLFAISDIIPKRSEPVMEFNAEERALLEQLNEQELSIEELQRRLKLPVIKLSVLLMSLVMRKVLREYPGKIYKKVI